MAADQPATAAWCAANPRVDRLADDRPRERPLTDFHKGVLPLSDAIREAATAEQVLDAIRGTYREDTESMMTPAACGAFLALDHGDWAEENMNACELAAGHEPPHRQRFPAQDGVPAYVVEWADDAWWPE